jgi:hypothetical protein
MGTVLGLLALLVVGVLVAFGLLHLGFLLIDRINHNPNPKPKPRTLSPAERMAFLAEMEALDRESRRTCKHHDH